MTPIKSNLWKIYFYKFLSEFYLIVPVLIPYYKANNLTSTQIFTVQAAYALAVLVLEIPSGYLADIIGRKKTLILGAMFLPLGISIYAFTNNFFTFILAEFVVAIGNSMRSGCDSAIIYDSLIQMNQESEYKKFEGKCFFFTNRNIDIFYIRRFVGFTHTAHAVLCQHRNQHDHAPDCAEFD